MELSREFDEANSNTETTNEEKIEIKIEKDIYFEPKDSSDLIIRVGEDEQSQNFHCHSFMLSIASPVFKEQLDKCKESKATNKCKATITNAKKELIFPKKKPLYFGIMLKSLYPTEFDLSGVPEPEVEESGVGEEGFLEAYTSEWKWREMMAYHLLKFADEFKIDYLFQEIDLLLAAHDENNEFEANKYLLIFSERYPDQLPLTRHRQLHLFRLTGSFKYSREYLEFNTATKLDLITARQRYLRQLYNGTKLVYRDNKFKDDCDYYKQQVMEVFELLRLD